MNRRLILIKHSLPEIVKNLPANKWQLSDEGRVLAKRLAHQLLRFEPEVIITSNEPKAKETAQIIAENLQLELHVAEGLHEHERSNVLYLSQADFQTMIHEFFQKPDVLVFGKETANQAHARFSQAVHFNLKSNADKTVAIVAHGTVISLFVSHLAGISGPLLWHELGLPSFVVIDLQSNTLIARENKI